MIPAGLVILALVLGGNAPFAWTPRLPEALRGFVAFTAACVLTLGTFVASLLVDAACDARLGIAGLPFAAVTRETIRPDFQSDVAALAAFAQTAALAFFVVRLRERPLRAVESVVLGTATIVALAFALVVPEVRTADLYLYAGYSAIPDPNAGQHAPFPPAFAVVQTIWQNPLPSTLYGPLWETLGRLVASPFATLEGRLYAFRAIGLAAVALGTYAYARIRDPATAIALFAFNPAVLNQYVVDAHNDGSGLALLLCALIPGTPLALRGVLATLAGNIKYSFVLISSVVFEGSLRMRVSVLAAVAAVTLNLAFATHSGFVHSASSQYRDNLLGKFGSAIHVESQILAAGVLILAFVFGRYLRFGGLALISFGIQPLQWYLGWGIPYAIRGNYDRDFLVLLPVLATAIDQSYSGTPAHVAQFAFLLALALASALRIGPFRVAETRPEAEAS